MLQDNSESLLILGLCHLYTLFAPLVDTCGVVEKSLAAKTIFHLNCPMKECHVELCKLRCKRRCTPNMIVNFTSCCRFSWPTRVKAGVFEHLKSYQKVPLFVNMPVKFWQTWNYMKGIIVALENTGIHIQCYLIQIGVQKKFWTMKMHYAWMQHTMEMSQDL